MPKKHWKFFPRRDTHLLKHQAVSPAVSGELQGAEAHRGGQSSKSRCCQGRTPAKAVWGPHLPFLPRRLSAVGRAPGLAARHCRPGFRLRRASVLSPVS